MSSSIIASNYESLTEAVGHGRFIGQCAALVQWYGCNRTALWRRGAPIKGNPNVPQGTCIATFRGRRYRNAAHGNHAAIYVEQDGRGITVYDQWTGKPPSYRLIKFKRHLEDPSNNGNCFSVILTRPYTRAPYYRHARTAADPKMPEEAFRVVRSITDRSLRIAFKKAIRDEVLTLKDVQRLIRSTKDFKRTSETERQELLLILSRVTVLDDKSRQVLLTYLRKITFTGGAQALPM